ncbi:MAG: hypothetical protein NC341_00790 [Blautia sp.]|nr:hypothetical protein [Blautia sp.]MCM1202159.1 hypothetical protein [Bacteroides fragilis]
MSGRLEANAVYAGVPCRKLMTLDDFYRKRKSRQAEEYMYIKNLTEELHYPEELKKQALREYFMFFEKPENWDDLDEMYKGLIERTGYGDFIMNCRKLKDV